MKKKTYEDYMVEINATGAFVEGTIFTLLPKDESGRTDKWIVYCPTCANDEYAKAGVCDGHFKSFTGNLVKGVKPCRCSNKPQYTPEQWTYRVTKAIESTGGVFEGWIDKIGNKMPIAVSCPVHNRNFRVDSKDILRGKGGCYKCTNHELNLGYIAYILNDDGEPYAIKFGITHQIDTREIKLNQVNKHKVRVIKVFRFETRKKSRDAETTIKHTLPNNVVERVNFQHGFTETTSILNIQSVIEIFQSFGGEEE